MKVSATIDHDRHVQAEDCDVLVIGSGLAGLTAALRLAERGRVLLCTKGDPSESNTRYAQGGIAAVVDPSDRIEDHVRDTLGTGGGLCHEQAVREIIEAGPGCIHQLEAQGIIFEPRGKGREGYDLGQEGGHSRRRVLHAGDVTGKSVSRILLERVREDPRIELRPGCMAIDLINTAWLNRPGPNRCLGAYVLDVASGEVKAIRAPCTVLATGGAGKTYLYTSNPDVATGDGVAMAWRAGLPVCNMEMVQFHPTCLYHPEAKSFLISEAVRGEGAELVNADGVAFMKQYDKRGSLAPRDVTARAIDHQMKSRGDTCVFLDIRHKSRPFLRRRFPTIYSTCLDFGVDMASDLIPVVPAAHYFCGGVEADTCGRTALPGLYAVGETTCTGLHGANRLASNSLLEAVVCASRLGDALHSEGSNEEVHGIDIPAWRTGDAVPSDEAVVVEHNWDEVRRAMWDYVGIVRTDKRLERALRRVQNLRREIHQYYLSYLVSADMLELRNIAAVAELVIRCAQARQESRGLHYTLDYPDTQPPEQAADTRIVDRPGGPVPED